MKKYLLLWTLLFPFAALAQNPATVTGHALYPSGAAPVNASVCFTLQNFKPNLPRLTGTGVLVHQQNWCISPSTVDGSFSTPVDRSDFITPAGTYWRVDYLWNNIQQSSANFLINTSPFNLDTAVPLSQIPPIGPNQIITQVFSCPNPGPSTTWTCTHNFNDVNVEVETYNISGAAIYPDTVTVTSPNIVTITFVVPQAGLAVILHGAQNISIATNQPNAIVSNPIAPQTIQFGQPLTLAANTTISNGGALNGTFSGTPAWSGLHTFNGGLTSAGPNTLTGVTLSPAAAGNNQPSSALTLQSTNSIGGHPQSLLSEDTLGDLLITNNLFNGNVTVTPGTNGASYTFSFLGANANVTQTIGSGTVTTAGTVVNAGTSQAQTAITITGALTTDVAICALNASPVATWQTGIQMLPPVVTANTVTVWLSNPTAGSITPAATVVRCTVTR